MAGAVPVAQSLSDIYTEDAISAERKRWSNLVSAFAETYKQPPQFVARSPGRVNIIGEHIDYSLYSVLPMAIAADALLAVSADTTAASAPGANGSTCRVEIANVQRERFPARTFDVPVDGSDVHIDASVHEWTNYFKSGLRGALQLLRRKHGAGFGPPASMRVLVDGTVPAGGGLSSSAAFVTASALAVMVANGEREVDKTELTELAIVSERAVGVNSGGMDQSASVFSERGSALFVSFSPRLTARPVQFPRTSPALTFVVAQSFVAADKHVTGPIHYNLRVVECSLAAAYLNAVLNPPSTRLPQDASPLGVSLHGFHETYFALQDHAHATSSRESKPPPRSAEDQLTELLALTRTTLAKEEGYTRDEICAALGLSPDELHTQFTSRFPVRAERFRLRQRALHVFGEALRVLQFLALLEGKDDGKTQASTTAAAAAAAGAADTNKGQQLGALLEATQQSCRDLYECSCPELDALCNIARRAGSYGSRLTGAGWGGCSVHLVPADKVDAVRAAWEAEYYGKRELNAEQRATAVVVSRPGSGSAVYHVPARGTVE